MLLLYLRTLYCKSRMVAYVNGELPPAARRRIARYIERYPTCYAEYVKQKDAARELNFRLPLVGQPDKPTMDRIWMAVSAEMTSHHPDIGSGGTRKRRLLTAPLSFRVRYGMLGLAMALTLAVPLTFSANHTAFAVSLTQPIPMTATGLPTDDTGLPTNASARAQVSQGKVLQANLVITQVANAQGILPAPALPQATAVSTSEK
jgi:anti-sigma factor RsiW